MLYICVRNVMFCLHYDAWICRCSCMGSMSVVMLMLYVCVLCDSCGSSQCCVLHHLLVEDARGDHMEDAYSITLLYR